MTVELDDVLKSGDIEEIVMGPGYTPDKQTEAAIVNHTHPATVITYDNSGSGLAANQTQAAIDEVVSGGGVIEYGATATGANAIEVDVNAMDWTGHAHAIGSALNITVNAIVYFSNDNGVVYKWMGQKGVTVGLGGSYVTLSTDYIALSVGSHNTLAGRSDADGHPTAAITGLDTALGLALHSDITGIAGAVKIANAVSLTQAAYDALTPDAATLYIIVG